jgi:predicted Zn-dependent peptidase
MDIRRNEILPGVFLSCIQTDKFKTGCLSINLATQLNRETAAKNALLPRVLARGTKAHPDMDSIAKELDHLYGARIDPMVRKYGEIQLPGFYADFIDDAYVPGHGRLLEPVAALMGEMLLSPNTRGGLLLPDYVESEKEKLLDDIRSVVNDKRSYAMKRLVDLMCSGEDFAVSKLGELEEAESINYQKLSKHYKSLLPTTPIEIFYCGTADWDRVASAMREALDTLPRGEIDYDIGTDIRMNALEEQARVYTETMDVTQGKLSIGFRLGSFMEDPDPAVARVFNSVYGSGMNVNSKLFTHVRERLSLCYYASSALNLAKGIMVVSSGIEASNYDAARSEIFAQLEAVRQGEITEEELEIARQTERSELYMVQDSPGALEGFYLNQNLSGLDYGPNELAAMIEDVTKEQVMALAQGVECDAIYFLTGDTESSEEALGEEEESNE